VCLSVSERERLHYQADGAELRSSCSTRRRVHFHSFMRPLNSTPNPKFEKVGDEYAVRTKPLARRTQLRGCLGE